jgi:hypothetical protein
MSHALCARFWRLIAVKSTLLPTLAAQFVTADDAERFLSALLTAFAKFVACKTDDAEQYLLGWVATELALADAQAADDG